MDYEAEQDRHLRYTARTRRAEKAALSAVEHWRKCYQHRKILLVANLVSVAMTAVIGIILAYHVFQ